MQILQALFQRRQQRLDGLVRGLAGTGLLQRIAVPHQAMGLEHLGAALDAVRQAAQLLSTRA